MDRLAFFTGLVGKPYRIGARGPDAYDCYGLARHVQRELAGVEMPDIPPVEPTTRAMAEALLVHPERQAWDEVPEGEARELDLVLMGNVAKRDFHLGTVIQPSTRWVILHIDRTVGVVADDAPALRASGFNHLTFYRRR
jgi:hypothetical protein